MYYCNCIIDDVLLEVILRFSVGLSPFETNWGSEPIRTLVGQDLGGLWIGTSAKLHKLTRAYFMSLYYILVHSLCFLSHSFPL